jgi:hypothetical protein
MPFQACPARYARTGAVEGISESNTTTSMEEMIMSTLGDEVFLVLVERLEELAIQESQGFSVGPQLEAVRWLLQTRPKTHDQSIRQDSPLENPPPPGTLKQ